MNYVDKYVRVVKKEMDRMGFDIIIQRADQSIYDPATSTISNVVKEFECRGLLFDLNLQSNGDGTKYNTLIEAGDKQLFIQPPEDDGFYHTSNIDLIRPNKDTVKIGDRIYTIVTFKQLNPSTQNSVLFECYIRG